MTTRHFSDLAVCYQCQRLLNDYEEVYCGPCARIALDALDEPNDAQLARRDANIERGWRELAAVIAGTLVLCLTLASWVHTAHAEGLTVTRTINDRPYTWTLPEAGCQLVRGFEDGSSTAWCPSGMYAYDPDGAQDRAPQTWYEVETTR